MATILGGQFSSSGYESLRFLILVKLLLHHLDMVRVWPDLNLSGHFSPLSAWSALSRPASSNLESSILWSQYHFRRHFFSFNLTIHPLQDPVTDQIHTALATSHPKLIVIRLSSIVPRSVPRYSCLTLFATCLPASSDFPDETPFDTHRLLAPV